LSESHESKARILVIDDEAGMREGCRRALTPAGYNVATAADLATGLDMVRTGHYELYLLDVMLPDGSGLDLIDPILEHDPGAICIIITGFGSIEMAVEAVRRGAYDFLSKPFTSDELLMSVSQGLERRELKAIEAQAEELAQAKAELERLDEIKSQLMLKVAHELRAPVAAVQSYINLINTGYVAEDELSATLSRIQERLEGMSDLISDLLELARLKQARDLVPTDASPHQMADILTEVCELFQEPAREKQQSLQVEILDRPVILANRDHLEEIWTNLISNAIKYTPEGGRISVSLRTDHSRLIGTVVDSGIGIREEDLPHLFQEFFRSDEAKASGEIGTGLGLSIVKQIVDSYGGEIKVTSQPGQGSRFTFSLPLEPATTETQEDTPAPRKKPSHRSRYPTTHTRPILFGDDSVQDTHP
jgi:two-component system sensor histidine kinase/response regulator